MILCDSNVWLALVIPAHAHHTIVRDWLGTVADAASVYFCRVTQQTFLRLLTNGSVVGAYGVQPLSNEQAWSYYQSILADDRIAFLHQEPAGLEDRWKQFTLRDSPSPKLWMDAYLAAFALAGGYRFVTIDKAFSQFDGLNVTLLRAADS